jgi:class 3 adenylate cyclase
MVGDGLLAIFGAPMYREDHCEQAVLAAMEMMDLLAGFNQEQAARGRTEIKIGIGIATGQMVAGYTGTQHRAIYTCIGDTINLAARIEDYTKQAGRPILMDKFTRESLPDGLKVDSLGAVTFKGKNRPVNIFAIPAQ